MITVELHNINIMYFYVIYLNIVLILSGVIIVHVMTILNFIEKKFRNCVLGSFNKLAALISLHLRVA